MLTKELFIGNLLPAQVPATSHLLYLTHFSPLLYYSASPVMLSDFAIPNLKLSNELIQTLPFVRPV